LLNGRILVLKRKHFGLGHSEPDFFHAKCIVVNERKALATSANFTEAAQMGNIEAAYERR
jgi:phosphatidylserine/phosphatidylglycerophosphate/cardiolipin synthase-like enzyme